MDKNIAHLGLLIDKADNYLEYETFPAPPQGNAIARSALVAGLKEIREELKAIYLDLGGEDVWHF
jgi:hypothetical protein